MASNEVSEMFAKADIVKKLEEFRPGCDMGEREYIWRDEAANLLIEESDVMIRLFQGINKAMMDYEKYKQDIAEGYTTLEKVKERWEFRRHGLRTQHVASGMIRSLDDDNRYWKEYYHELVVDDKLLQSDLEQFMRSLQYTGDQGWSFLLDKLVEFQNQTVDEKNQIKNRLMQTIKVFFLITQHLPPMRRVWERKEEIMPILVHKCMGQSYDTLRQTALVIILHLILATKDPDDIDWLAVDCGFAKKLLYFLKSASFLKERVALHLNHVMMSYIALLELGGDKTREKVKSLNIDTEFKRLIHGPKATKSKKSMTAEEKLTKGLLQTYLTLAEDHTAVKYFTKYSREKRIAFRWEYRGVPVFCSNTDCARPQEPNEKFRHCSRCMVTYYCSTECQKQHWKNETGGPRHKDVCVPIPESQRRKAEEKSDKKEDDAGKETKGSGSSGGDNEGGKAPEATGGGDSSSEDKKEDGDNGDQKQQSKGYATTTTIIFMPGTSDGEGEGADPTTDDVREEVQQKISKFGLTVDSVHKIDFRTNPLIQKIFKNID